MTFSLRVERLLVGVRKDPNEKIVVEGWIKRRTESRVSDIGSGVVSSGRDRVSETKKILSGEGQVEFQSAV